MTYWLAKSVVDDDGEQVPKNVSIRWTSYK